MLSVNTLDVAAPAEEIFTFLMDIDNRSRYIPQLKEVIPIDPLPFKEGSKYIEVATIAGRDLKTTYQITVLVQNRIVSARTLKSIFPIQVDLILDPIPDGTQLTIRLEFKLKGLFKLASNLVKGVVDDQARGILQKINSELT